MNDKHPITPPPELVQQWLSTYFGTTVTGKVSGLELALATQAAQWGADQELEECCAEVLWQEGKALAAKLRDRRRPKPPSLKEQALKALHTSVDLDEFPKQYDTIRRALEALPE
jgi:hypothetical protein